MEPLDYRTLRLTNSRTVTIVHDQYTTQHRTVLITFPVYGIQRTSYNWYIDQCVLKEHTVTHTHTHTHTHTQAKTRKYVGAESRHDMRPSAQLPSVSGADSKLGLTMVWPSLQSVPEPWAPPPVSKHVRQIWAPFASVTSLHGTDARA